MEYSKKFPLDLVNQDERVYIVDFHVQDDDDFRKLQEITKRITLIDHHKSTVEHLGKHPELYCDIEAIINAARSACLLTWDYFVRRKLMADYFNDDFTIIFPESLKLIDDMDRWIWQYGDKTANFCEGMRLYPHQPTDAIWKDLLMFEKSDDRIIDIIAEGEICNQYSKMTSNDYCKSYGFETEFEGYKAFAQGMSRGGSKAFGERINHYPLCLSFEFTGSCFIIGLYSETIDVSEIAMKHGGGGHKGAAGFVCDELPFRGIKCN